MLINAINQNLNRNNNYRFNSKPIFQSVKSANLNAQTQDSFSHSRANVSFEAGFNVDKNLCELIIPNNEIYAIKHAYRSLIDAIEEVKVPSTDNLKLAAWYLPPADKKKPIFLFLNGTDSNRTHQQRVAKFFHDEGYGALMMDYRGFGGNPGKASEKGLYQDAEAGLSYLFHNRSFTDDRIILWGYSMGGAVAVKTVKTAEAQGHNLRGVIDSTFTNGNKIKKHFLKAGVVDVSEFSPEAIADFKRQLKDPDSHIQFNTMKRIKKIQSPMLFIHSNGDGVIPARMSQELHSESQNGRIQIVDSRKIAKSVHKDRTWAFEPIKDFVNHK